MLRHNSNTHQASNSSPLTRAQLQAAIEAEERRQGLAPDSLVAESTLEEAARRLGIPSQELREKALRASTPRTPPKARRAFLPVWTHRNRKLFTAGVVLALAITAIEGVSRLQIFQRVQQASRMIPRSRSGSMSPFNISPIDQRFKDLLAKTVGPNPTLRMVTQNMGSWSSTDQIPKELFPLEGVPDGYEVYIKGADRYNFNASYPTSYGVAFRPAEKFQETIDPSRQEETELSWRFVRYGNQWYARAWINPSELSKPSKTYYKQVDVSTSPVSSFTEIVLPAESAQTRLGYESGSQTQVITGGYYVHLPSGFKVNPELVAATKTRGAFRTNIPSVTTNNSYNTEFQSFKSAKFSVSSLLVDVEQIKEGQPFSVPDHMLGLLTNDKSASYEGSQSTRRVDLRPETSGNWNLVRYGKTLYLRGWIAGPVRKESLGGNNLLVSSSPENPHMGYQPTKITVPLNNFRGGSIASRTWSTATFTNVILDKHAWEQW